MNSHQRNLIILWLFWKEPSEIGLEWIRRYFSKKYENFCLFSNPLVSYINPDIYCSCLDESICSWKINQNIRELYKTRIKHVLACAEAELCAWIYSDNVLDSLYTMWVNTTKIKGSNFVLKANLLIHFQSWSCI